MKRKIALLLSLVMCISVFLSVCVYADALIVDPSPIEYGYQDTDFYVVVSAPDDYVNHRFGPGLTYDPPIQRVYNGTELHIIATCENSRDGQTWGKCIVEGYEGWVSTNQCTVVEHRTEPDTTEAVTTTAPVTEETMTPATNPTTVSETQTQVTLAERTTKAEKTEPETKAQAKPARTGSFNLMIIIIILVVVVVALSALVILLAVFLRKRK